MTTFLGAERLRSFTFALRRVHDKMTANEHSEHMRKLVVLIVVLGVLTTVGTAGAASTAIPGFPSIPGKWSHVDINRKMGQKWHTLTLDRGRITQANTTQLTLREPDGSLVVIPLTPQAIVRIYGVDATIYFLRRGMNAMTMRIDGGPAVRIRVFR